MSSNTEGFTVNLTNKMNLPDLNYINELAAEKNFKFGGEFVNLPPILEDLYSLFYQEREEGEDFDFKNHVFSRDIIKEKLDRDLTESEQAYYKYTLKFLEGLNYSSCPGYTPLDKSLNTIMYMNYLSEKQNNQGAQSDPSKSKTDMITPKEMNRLIKEMSEGIVPPGEEGQEDKSIPPTELSKDVISCVRDFLYDLSPGIANIYAKEKMADVPINPAILRDIKIKSYLEEKIGLETSLEKKLVVNNKSKKKRSTNMSDYGQVMKTNKTNFILPNFDDKLVKKELVVREKILPETRKQVVTFMLDDSGSMGSIQKQSYVRAALLSYLEGVIKGTCKLNFYLYESKRYGYTEVKNLEDAQKLFKLISLRSPSGGGTHIGYILQETINEIASDATYHDPEIVVVNDGDDFVNPAEVNCKGVKLNAIMLGCENANLRKLCTDSGGWVTSENMYNRY